MESGVCNSEVEWLCFEAHNLFALNKRRVDNDVFVV